jgi:hypothetical protein
MFGMRYRLDQHFIAGRVFAEQSLFLTISMVLATLRISKAKDPLGAEIDPVLDYHSEGTVM